MMTKTVKCPTCQQLEKITGNSGEKKTLSCAKCGSNGIYVFPDAQQESQSLSGAYAIEVNALSKIYNKIPAVNNVSFSVKRGEIFGFLGPNGAGKTTTIKAMLDLITVNAGNITLNGINVKTQGKEAKKYIGYLPENVAFYNGLTAVQNLSFYAEMKNATREECKALIEEFGLGDAANKKVGAFSKGMVQRLGMARAMLGNPPIFILDEPSGGLDPRGVVLIRDKIRQLQKNGATLFVSSHLLSEIQEVCSRVGIINRGVLVAQDSVSMLSHKLNLKPKITIEVEQMTDAIASEVKKIPGVDHIEIEGKRMQITCDGQTKATVIMAISNAGGNIVNLQTKEPSLEEVFMRYTEA